MHNFNNFKVVNSTISALNFYKWSYKGKYCNIYAHNEKKIINNKITTWYFLLLSNILLYILNAFLSLKL